MLNIKKQTEMIKLQCLLISYNSDFENFALSKDETLLKNIDFFVHQASNQDIKFLAKSLKKDLDYLDNLFVLLDKTLYLDYKINDKENEIIKRNSDFKEYQEDVLELKMSEESLNNEVNNQVVESEKILKKIEEFDNSNQSLSINELRIIADDYLNYILNGDFLIKILHFLTLNVFKNDKKEAIKQIKNRQRLIEMIYSDYEYELSKEIDNLKKLSNNIKKSINQLSWLKMVFDNKFYKYKDVLPEYKIIYEKLANLDKQLLKSKESVDLLENNLNIEKSKVKVKKFS